MLRECDCVRLPGMHMRLGGLQALAHALDHMRRYTLELWPSAVVCKCLLLLTEVSYSISVDPLVGGVRDALHKL